MFIWIADRKLVEEASLLAGPRGRGEKMRVRIRAKLIVAFLFVAGVSLIVASVVPLQLAAVRLARQNQLFLDGQREAFNQVRLRYRQRAETFARRLQEQPQILRLLQDERWSEAARGAEEMIEEWTEAARKAQAIDGQVGEDIRFRVAFLPPQKARLLADSIEVVQEATGAVVLVRSVDLGLPGRAAFDGTLTSVREQKGAGPESQRIVAGLFVGFPLIKDLSPLELLGEMFQPPGDILRLIQKEIVQDLNLYFIQPDALKFRDLLARNPGMGERLFQEQKIVSLDNFSLLGEVWQVRLEPIYGPSGEVITIAFLRIQRPRMLASWKAVQKNFTIAALVSSLLAVLLAVRISKSFSRPIRMLSRRAHAVAGGDLDEPVEVRSRDEIGDLATAFNTMQAELRRTLGELKRRAETIERQNIQLDHTIHELSRMKDYTENVLQSVRVGVVTIDRDRKVTKINDTALQILEAEGRSVEEIKDILTQEPLNAVVEAGLHRGETITGREFEFSTFGGRPRPVDVTSGLLRRRGEVIGLVLSFRDLTLMKALQDQVRRQDRLASLGHLSAGVAHEIRNPLAIIKGSAEILRRRFGGQADEEGLTHSIIEEVNRLSEVVTNFLDFARPKEPTIVQGDLNGVIHKALALAGHHRSGESVRVESELASDLPPVPMDPEQCQQVFLNLILNALEAMRDGGVLTVRSRVDEVSGCAVVEVQDTGEGIDEETRGNIFDPFFTSKEQGTGLGLSVVHMIVAAHGGRIEVDSEPGQGSVFRVFFPLEAGVKEEAESPVPPLVRGD